MPAKSENQRISAAIALHGDPKPGSASAKMRKSMNKNQLHDFAKGTKKKLPKKISEGITFVDFLINS